GGFETSLMMALQPELVREDHIVSFRPPDRGPFFSAPLLEEPKVTLVRPRRPGGTGLGGDPSLGARDKGERLLEMAVASVAEFVVYYASA
ncbi:MAG TPA: creatininase family protein, partial [Chloroflexota bacterium]|nr:creatininase family protein [Chloroflexota bacterium]